MNANTKKLIIKECGTLRGQPVPGFEEFVLPVIEKILESSRHLSATRLGQIASGGGIDYRGSTKTHSAAALANALFGFSPHSLRREYTKGVDRDALERLCRKLRFSANGWSRKHHTYGTPAPAESDREYIQSRLAEVNSKVLDAGGDFIQTKGYDRENQRLRDEKRTLESCLKVLGEGVGNFTLELDSRAKFFAVLEALQQYVDNGEDADHLSDDPELQAKIDAASALRDQLDATLASLAE